MKKVLSILLSILLVFSFFVGALVFNENLSLRSDGKMAVFSFEKYLHNFSEISFPTFSISSYINTSFLINGNKVTANDLYSFIESNSTFLNRSQILSTFNQLVYDYSENGVTGSITVNGYTFTTYSYGNSDEFYYYAVKGVGTTTVYRCSNVVFSCQYVGEFNFLDGLRAVFLGIGQFFSAIFQIFYYMNPSTAVDVIDLVW